MPQSDKGSDLTWRLNTHQQFVINVSVVYLLSTATWQIILKHNGLKQQYIFIILHSFCKWIRRVVLAQELS